MRRLLHLLFPLSFFLLLSLVLTYPLITQFATHVNGSPLWALDEYIFVWNTWWFQHSWLHLQQPPLQTQYLYYPLGIDFALYTFNFFNAALALPLLAWLPLPAAVNIANLFSLVISAYGAYLLTKWALANGEWRITNSQSHIANGEPPSTIRHSPFAIRYWSIESAALCAGIAYTFTTHTYVYLSIGHYDMISTEWFPFCALYLLKWRQKPLWRYTFMAALGIAFTLYIETFFGVFLACLFLLYALVMKPWRTAGWRTWLTHWAVTALLAGMFSAPVLMPALRESLSGDYALKGWGSAQQLSVDLLGFVSPSALITWSGLDWTQEMTSVIKGQGRFADVNTVFLGYATLVLAALGWFTQRRATRLWALGAALWALFALGPLLQIGGQSTFDLDGLKVNFPMPFIVLHYLPVIKANRVANRFSVLLGLSLAALVGYGVHFILRKLEEIRGDKRRLGEIRGRGRRALISPSFLLFPLISLLLIIDHLSIPLPMTDARVPAFYTQLARDADAYTILTVPLGWRNSFGTLGAEDTRVQSYQSVHQKRLLGGYTSRNHPYKFDYFAQLPIVASLSAIEDYQTVPPEVRDFDRTYADEFIRFFDLRYVVAHPPVNGRKPYDDTRAAALNYLLDVLPLERVNDTGELEVYRVRQPAPQRDLVVDFGEPASRAYRGEGWGEEEEIAGLRANWAAAQRARTFLPVSTLADHRLSFSALPFTFPNAPAQSVTLIVNGRVRLPVVALKEGWQQYEITVPAAALQEGVNEVVWEFAYARAPREVLPSDDARTLAAAVDWVRWQQ